ncbi:hypothetical protein JG688_00002981 [Phytophthora aleatoria]|uniref:Uncharacterized protein n=1 Tax=Phytophthora aleatoria TaxID=2496075 RepID=A0A8J5MAC6_9STRA|nr:hypothetical protein JG688_00002981 [Phytophthora aleatoria]
MALDALLHGDETVHLQPLLERSDGGELSEDDFTSRRRRERKNPSWIVMLGAGVAMLLIVHILFVALLRKTMVALDKLTLPDLCHRKTVGEVVMEFQNPSYCSPVVGPLNITFSKKDTAFLHLQVPAFKLQSGVTTMISPVGFKLLTEPEVFYSLVFADADTIDVHGEIPVLISCMLVPFTIHLDVSNLLRETSRPPVNAFIPPKWRYALDQPLYGANVWESGVVNGIKEELQRVVTQVLNLVDVKVEVPAKIDDKPALLREYSIKPSLKELDSKAHKCLLELKVSIKINNPLPIHFNLYGIELDLLYEKDTSKDHSSPKFLVHVKDIKHVSWLSHEENSIELVAAVHDFDTCVEVVGFYLHDQLVFDIRHGHISMGAGSGNFSIPFSAKGIHIHPGQSNNGTPMGASFSRYLCLAVGVAYPAYASFKALERPESGHDEKQWLTYWVVYGASTSVETVASPLMCLVPGYNITKTLFLIWMMSPQTRGATIVYDKLLCPFLKEKEPYVDRKLQEAQEAAEGALSSFVRAWGQTIADQVVAIQKSDEFKQICLAIKALASPDSPKKRRKKSTGSKSKQSASEE